MPRNGRKAAGLASLYEQVLRTVYEKRGPADLQPAQWSALRFFRRAGASARTVSGLANFLGVTMGPASRTARTLRRRGFLTSSKNPKDARSIIFTLTGTGNSILKMDPLLRLARAMEALDAKDQVVFTRVIGNLYDELDSQ